MREVADHHPGVRREREARKRGPRHRFWPSAAAAAAAGAAGAAADGHSAWEGSQKLKIGAPKRPFRLGGVAKVGGPAPQNHHSAWEGPQNLYIGNLPIVRLWRLLPCRATHTRAPQLTTGRGFPTALTWASPERWRTGAAIPAADEKGALLGRGPRLPNGCKWHLPH